MKKLHNLTLTRTVPEDLLTLFEFQADPEGQYLAAFTPKDSNDRAAYINKYTPFLTDPTITMCTIRSNEKIVGIISKFVLEGDAELTYWIDKPYWGQGIATQALAKLLEMVDSRPIYARVAFDNYGSQQVLKKCGFTQIGVDKGFANARQAEIEEFIFQRTN